MLNINLWCGQMSCLGSTIISWVFNGKKKPAMQITPEESARRKGRRQTSSGKPSAERWQPPPTHPAHTSGLQTQSGPSFTHSQGTYTYVLLKNPHPRTCLLILQRSGRERECEKHQCTRETDQLPLTHLNWGPNLQSRHVLWLGIKPSTFWFME